MNAKHYVSLEVAKMLKEKGYNEECYFYYKEADPALYHRELYNRNSERDDIISAPTLLEAMDWLEESGIRIEILWSDNYHLWYSTIKLSIVTITEMGYYADRNECMNETIKKGLELL